MRPPLPPSPPDAADGPNPGVPPREPGLYEMACAIRASICPMDGESDEAYALRVIHVDAALERMRARALGERQR